MLKYIIFEDLAGIPFPIIFSCLVQHETMRQKFSNYNVLSAGKLNKNFKCIHGSVSLGIKPNQNKSVEDEDTIRKLMEFN